MANTATTLATAFKYVAENKLHDLKPNSAIVQDIAGALKESDQIGRKYLCPVVLSYELGFTFGTDAFTYNDDIAGVYDEIEVDCSPVVLKSRVGLEAADRMAKTQKTVLSHAALRLGQMKTSLMKMAEIECLYGRQGFTISALGSVNTSPDPDQRTITFDTDWAPGVWAGMVGAALDGYDGSTKQNSNADFNLVSVDFANKQIVISGHNTDLTNLAVGEKIFFKGAKTNGMYGIHYQLDNATTLFGIDAATYDLWKASEFAVTGAFTVAKILEGLGKAQEKGGLDEDVVVLCSTKAYEALNADVTALRMFDDSYKDVAEIGNKGITIKFGNGKATIIGHPMVMQGYAYSFPKAGIKKVGSTDITFGSPVKQGEIIEHLESVHAYQVIGRYSYQILLMEPAKCVLFTGIT